MTLDFSPQWISLVIQILVLIATVAGFIKVIYNDLTHLNIDMKDSKNKLEKVEAKISNIETGLCSMKAVCNERHKRGRKI